MKTVEGGGGGGEGGMQIALLHPIMMFYPITYNENRGRGCIQMLSSYNGVFPHNIMKAGGGGRGSGGGGLGCMQNALLHPIIMLFSPITHNENHGGGEGRGACKCFTASYNGVFPHNL